MKKCKKCLENKTLDNYNKCALSRDRLSYWCKDCLRVYKASEYQRNKETYLKYNRSEKAKRAMALYRKTDRARRLWRNRHLMRKFGITIEEYESMYLRQNGVCAICHSMNLNGKNLSVDHDHKSGKVRSLLCDPCNTTLGKVNEDINWLHNMEDYLEKWKRIYA